MLFVIFGRRQQLRLKSRIGNDRQRLTPRLRFAPLTQAAIVPPDKELYQRQIEATDRQIEALVYELHGLTEATDRSG